MTINERLTKIVAEQLGVAPEAVTPDAKFADDLGADSLDKIELVMAVEEEFDIEIDDPVAEPWKTVGDVETYLNSIIH